MKVFQLAKELGWDSKEILDALKGKGFAVKTPLSLVPEDALNFIYTEFPKQLPKTSGIVHKVLPVEEKVEVPVDNRILKVRPFDVVPAEGLETRFSQYVMGIRRRIIDGRKTFSVLTVAFDPVTLEFKLLKEDAKRTDPESILFLKQQMSKRKVV